jgi:hypothetical protein
MPKENQCFSRLTNSGDDAHLVRARCYHDLLIRQVKLIIICQLLPKSAY